MPASSRVPDREDQRRGPRRDWLAAIGLAALSGVLSAEESPSIDSRELITPAADEAILLGLDWLANRQQDDGAFGSSTSFSRYHRNPAVCALSGLAWLSSGSTPGRGPYGAHLERVTRLLVSYANATGFLKEPNSDSDQQPMYGHGFACMFLAEVLGMSDEPRLRDVVHRAVQLIVDTQNREGGWRYHPEPRDADLSVTVCQLMALRAAHNTGIAVPRQTVDRAVAYITRCQNPDGGFKYQPLAGGESAFPRSAAAVVALYTSGAADSPAIAKGLRYLEQFRPGDARGLDRGYYFYAQYYAVQAAWHAGGETWRQWFPPLRDELLRQQLSAGQWSDPVICAEYATAMALIALQLPNNYLPIFQR